MKPIRHRLLEALESSPMAVDRLADQIGTTTATTRARLADFRQIGAVHVASKEPRGCHSVNVWAIVPSAKAG